LFLHRRHLYSPGEANFTETEACCCILDIELWIKLSIDCDEVCRQPAPEASIEEVKEAKEVLAIQLALAETKLLTRDTENADKQAKVEELAAIVDHQVGWGGGGGGQQSLAARQIAAAIRSCMS